jgi:hypothetical protein
MSRERAGGQGGSRRPHFRSRGDGSLPARIRCGTVRAAPIAPGGSGEGQERRPLNLMNEASPFPAGSAAAP